MKQVTVKKIAYAIISILFIINTSSVYMTEHFNVCISMLSAVLIVYNFISILVYKIKLRKTEVWIAVFLAVIFMLLFMAWHHVYIYGVYVLGILFPNIWLMLKIQIERNEICDFLSILVKISAFVALGALFFWIMGSTFGIIKPTEIVSISWGHSVRYVKSYYKLYYEAQNAAVDFGFVRFGVKNCAMFSEAPICAYVFTAAFIINENLELRKKWAYRILFLIAILSTLTTTGVLFACAMTIYFIARMPSKNKYETAMKRVIYSIVIVIAAVTVISVIQDKLVTYSGNIRVLKLQNECLAFLDAPIAGKGFNTYTDGSSNSITALLADGGILLWGIYYVPLIGLLIRKLKYKVIDYLLLSYIFVFAITVVQYTPIGVLMLLLFEEEKELN